MIRLNVVAVLVAAVLSGCIALDKPVPATAAAAAAGDASPEVQQPEPECSAEQPAKCFFDISCDSVEMMAYSATCRMDESRRDKAFEQARRLASKFGVEIEKFSPNSMEMRVLAARINDFLSEASKLDTLEDIQLSGCNVRNEIQTLKISLDGLFESEKRLNKLATRPLSDEVAFNLELELADVNVRQATLMQQLSQMEFKIRYVSVSFTIFRGTWKGNSGNSEVF
ncbi:MAG: DUF4349 domain-containing protein [Victivallaceae bacterium]|nr:DUF4349 domain-containing protein [Victivallaceae bacterium]